MAPRPPIQAKIEEQAEFDPTRRHWRMVLFNEDGTPFSGGSDGAPDPASTEHPFASFGDDGIFAALAPTITASSFYSGTFLPAYAIDGIVDNFWHSAEGAGSWLQFELTRAARIDSITIQQRPDTLDSQASRIDVTGSDDGVMWEDIGIIPDVEKGLAEWGLYPIPQSRRSFRRFIRLTFPVDLFASVAEIELYGALTNP